MKLIFISLSIFITFLSFANAGELYRCIDRNGNTIITSTPQDDMETCVLEDSNNSAASSKGESIGEIIDRKIVEYEKKNLAIEELIKAKMELGEMQVRTTGETLEALIDRKIVEYEKKNLAIEELIKMKMKLQQIQPRVVVKTPPLTKRDDSGRIQQQCLSDCASEKGTCLAECKSAKQCQNMCSHAYNRCVSRCYQ